MMDPARWNRIEELLQAALDRTAESRGAFLTAACGSDAALRREVDALLAQESQASSFLSHSPALALIGPRESLAGRTISRYHVLAKIGSGGMGEVYEAHDENLRRTVALKVLPEEFTSDAERVRRFEQEAFAASRLNHPNIVTIHEILHTEEAHFIAEELIDGKTVRDVLRESGLFAIDQALDVTIQAAEALKAAHTAWIIHRDIKPENIMVRADGLVKVLDFGIAKRNDEPSAPVDSAQVLRPVPSDLTAAGAILGTAKYMSPEQARGEPLDGRTDLFSLGLVFQEMLTGEREGKLDAVPKELQRIVRKLLRANREERYSTAGELLEDLRRAKHRFESRTARRMVGLGALAIVTAIAVAAVAAMLSIHESWDERVLRDGHTAAVRQAVFSPDGTKVVSCGEDGQVIVWDFARRERIATLPGHVSYKLAWSPDGRWLATGGADGSVAIWDPRRWRRVRTLRTGFWEIGALAFTPDSAHLLASGERTILWRADRWEKVHEWPLASVHGSFIVSPDGRQALLTTHLTALDLETGSKEEVPIDIGANWMVSSPDRSRLAAIDIYGRVVFYRLRRAGDLARADRTAVLRAHQDHGRAIAWSPDGKLVASGADDILLWDPETQRKVARFEYSSIVWSLAFSPDGRWLLSTHGDGAVLVWNVAERERVASLSEHSGAVRAVAFSPDGRHVASGGDDRLVTVWNVESGRREAVLERHATRVTGVAYSPAGELGSVDLNGSVVVWEVAARRPRWFVPPNLDIATYCLAIARDGTVATTHFIYGPARNEGHGIRWLTNGHVYGADLSADGRVLAVASTDGSVALIDIATRRVLARQIVRNTQQITVRMSADGTRLVTGEDQGAVRLWSVRPLRQLAILGRHDARVKSVAFSPDGTTVASAGDDKMIALWDVRRRKLLTRIGTHASPIYAIAFSPDGRQLVSGEHDRSVRVYTRRRTLWGMRLE